MSAVAALLDQVNALGGTVEPRGDRLHLCAPRPLPPDLVERLRLRKAEILTHLAACPAPQAKPAPARWPEGTALAVAPEWWTGSPFYVVRTEEERAALIGEGEHSGQIWTLEEARRLAGLSKDEKLDVARCKVEFSGEVVAATTRRARGGRT